MKKSLTEKVAKELIKLEATEFLGVCKILDVRPSHEDGQSRDFDEIWSDVIDKIDALSRIRKRNLYRLVREATKGRK